MNLIRPYDTLRLAQMSSGALSTKERAKAVFRDKLYTSLRTIRGDPTAPGSVVTTVTTGTTTTQSGVTTTTTTTTTTKPTTPSNTVPTSTYALIQNYTTLNGTEYGIRRTTSGTYTFRKGDRNASGFTTLTQITNFLERQNRIIYTAPNGREYGIFISDDVFYFNRDEGSISTNSWKNQADVEAYIDQHNQ
jgi:hypothetical protein